MIEKYLQRVQMRKMAQSPGSITFPNGVNPYKSDQLKKGVNRTKKYWSNPVTEPTPTPEYLKPKNDYSQQQAVLDIAVPGVIGSGVGATALGIGGCGMGPGGCALGAKLGVMLGGAGGASYGLGHMINRGLWQMGTVPYAISHMIDAKRYSNTLDKKLDKERDRILREQWIGK